LLITGRVLGGRCTGTVRVKLGRRARRARVRPDCRFRLRARVRSRSVRVVVRRGNIRVTRRISRR
ncbi:MAG TPA: hypothetical protein VGW10_13015, partial [Solirubrobacteraceae bacterium]|nr:hypothetical protein [Solirubrobacteraceae bacterium]